MIVAIHGFTGHPSVFSSLDCETLTVLGHGPDAPASEPVAFTDEVDRLASCLPDEPVQLLGYSMGGRLALALALRHPERVSELCLISATPGLERDDVRAERQRADARWSQLLRERGIEAFVDAWQSLPLWSSQDQLPQEIQDQQRELRLAHDPEQLALALDSLGTGNMPNLWPELGSLAMPVRVIVGSQDRKFCIIAERMIRQIPSATLHVIEECGHNPLLEQPDRVQELLL